MMEMLQKLVELVVRLHFHSTAHWSSKQSFVRLLAIVCSAPLLFASLVSANNWYVAPTGGFTNLGTRASPWDLITVFNGGHAQIQPGDTVLLRGGFYDINYNVSTYNRLEGAPNNPITIRQMPGERATIMGTIYQENSGWIVYRDFEIMHLYTNRISMQISSHPTDRPNRSLIALYSPNNKFINLVIHDSLANGIYISELAPNTEVYGCLFYNNGWLGPDRGHGHGLYSKNALGHNRYVNNVFCNGFSHGLHLFDEHLDAIQNYVVEGNVVFNSGIDADGVLARNLLIGGEAGVMVKNSTITGNYLYYPQTKTADTFNIGYLAGSTNNTVINNYFIGGRARIAAPHSSLQFSGNTIFSQLAGFTAAEFPSNIYQNTCPPTNVTAVLPDTYNPNRAIIVIYNWQNLKHAMIQLPSGLLKNGDSYELRNVQDYFNDIIYGTYDGNGSINIPMTGHTSAAPLGWKVAPLSFPKFGVFVLIKSEGMSPEFSRN